MGLLDEFFESLEGFQWDEGNSEKTWVRHEVAQAECEQLFLNRPIVVIFNQGHSKLERRFVALGRAAGPSLVRSRRNSSFIFEQATHSV